MRDSKTNRRTFLMHAGAVAAASTVELAHVAHASGSDTLKVGLVGCGGRGTGAAEQALAADKNVRLVAMADAFSDYLENSLAALKSSPHTDRVDVPPDRRYVGFDAYKNVIDQVDVVLLTTPPGFRPLHLGYAVEKGVHSFVEKPVATDATGVRKVLALCDEAKSRNLALVSGLCWRYHQPRRETMARVRDGAIGDIVAVETTYDSTGVWEPKKARDEVGSDMEYQMRNWYYHCWLSGDHIVEQAVHALDTMAWALGDEPPQQCWGVGGRASRIDPKYGDIWDHFALVYEYDKGVRGYHQCKHWRDTDVRVKDYILGSKGQCDVFGSKITGENAWRYRGPKTDMYQTEHDEMFASIRAANPINNGLYAARSTLIGIMGRTAAYTGQVITWDMALNSKETLVPEQFTWGELEARAVPRPGVTRYV